MAKPARHLRVVDAETGEVVREGVELAEAMVQIRMLERDLAGKRLRIAHLEANRHVERLKHPRRADVERVHAYWRKRCQHPRAELDDAAFFAIAAMIALGGQRKPEFAWPDDFKRAIDGAAFDPFVTTRKNGRQHRFDELELIFRDAAHVRDFINRAP